MRMLSSMSGRGRGDDEGEDLPLYLEVCRFEKSLIVFIFGGEADSLMLAT